MSKLMKLGFYQALVLLAVSGFSGCGSTPATNTAQVNKPAENKAVVVSDANAKPAENKPAENKSTDAKTGAAPTDIAAGGDKIGVPECDEYITKYEACVFTKVPEAARAAFKSSFEQTRKAWKDSAANPQAKAALATGCKQALDTAKQTLSAYSCDW